MDESLLWLNRLLKATAEHQLDKDMTKLDFQQLLLYWIAAHIVDWHDLSWIRTTLPPWMPANSESDRVQRLMHFCGRSTVLPSHNSDKHEALSNMVKVILDRLEPDERLALFDTLFYRIVAQVGVDRRHAELSAAFANGLARKEGLIDLQMYSGEPFIMHFNLDKGQTRYGYMRGREALQDLSRLRLAVHRIDSHSMKNQSTAFTTESLTLMDLPVGETAPLARLYNRLVSGELTQRTLVLFKYSPGSENAVLNDLQHKLRDDDLFEAAFEFTSYNAKGKATPFRAWLLNTDKFHGRKTLYIDTRHLQQTIPGVSSEQLAWFACAVCELWASPTKFRIVQFPHERMGLLQGLFSKYFHDGYRDVNGICALHDSQKALISPFNRRLVPAATSTESAFTLLDKHQLVDALDQAGQGPLCVYIIGDNGAGKSLLLASLAAHLQEQATPCAVIASGTSDRFQVKDTKDLYRYLGDKRKNGSSTQPIEKRLLGFLKASFALPGRGDLFQRVLESLGLKGRVYLAPIELFGELPPTEALFDRVIPLAQALNDALPIDGMTLALSRKGDSHMARFNDLSSGEQQVLLLLGKTLSGAGPGKVLLVDEPEISLHVRWQQLLPGCFSLIAKTMKTRFVIATHSPTLIANAQDDISECFLAKKQQLFPVPAEQRHSVETILLEGFETYTPHNREIAERCAALVAKAIRATNRDEVADDDPQQELLAELKEMDEIMANSGNPEDPRYLHDQQLIRQARKAITETFNFAQQGLGA